jgi:hypothetical protein
MTALYGPYSIDLPHVDIHKWAKTKKILLPYDFRKTPEEEYRSLRLLALKQFYIRGTREEEQKRFGEAVKEGIKYLSGTGISDATALIIQVGCHVLFCICVTVIPKIAKL